MNILPPVESFIKPQNLINSQTENEALSFISDVEFVKSNADIPKINAGSQSTVSYFWKYNTCNKGPRKKPCIEELVEYPHTSAFDYEDPIKIISDSETMSRVRKCETSTITPNLNNFIKIRNNIEKFSANYKDNLHKNGRISPKSRNILASKICRLRKKAYHESLKIKYVALGIEHEELRSMIRYLTQIKQSSMLIARNEVLHLKSSMLIVKASGRLDEFVTEVLDMIDNGHLTNQIIMKLTNNTKPEIQQVLYKQKPEDSPAGSDVESFRFDEFDFLTDDACFNDFLNSSGSTFFTDESPCLP